MENHYMVKVYWKVTPMIPQIVPYIVGMDFEFSTNVTTPGGTGLTKKLSFLNPTIRHHKEFWLHCGPVSYVSHGAFVVPDCAKVGFSLFSHGLLWQLASQTAVLLMHEMAQAAGRRL